MNEFKESLKNLRIFHNLGKKWDGKNMKNIIE